jgi:hypothetical protein
MRLSRRDAKRCQKLHRKFNWSWNCLGSE